MPDNPSGDRDEALNFELQRQAASANAIFVKSFEAWLMVSIQANYRKSDQEIVKRVMDSWKTLLEANVSYHEEVARIQNDDEPIVARQHRLLARMYRSLSENHNGQS